VDGVEAGRGRRGGRREGAKEKRSSVNAGFFQRMTGTDVYADHHGEAIALLRLGRAEICISGEWMAGLNE